MQVGTKQINQNDANVGESRTADRIIADAGFAVDKNGESIEEQGEMVLLQSKTLTVNDPAFQAAIADAVRALQAVPAGHEAALAAWHADHADLISKDGHSALIQFTPTGTYEEAVLYIDTIAGGGRQGRRRATRASTSSRPASRPTRRSTRRSRAASPRPG